MWREFMEKCPRPVRALLVDVALGVFIVTCLGFLRFLFVIADEAHQFRVDFDSQAMALREVAQLQGGDVTSSLQDIDVNSKVIIGRLDSQLTEARIAIKKASEANVTIAKAEAKTTREVLKSSLGDTTDAIQTATDQNAEAAKKPVQVNIEPAKPQVVTPPPVVNVQPILPPTPEKIEPKRNVWSKFWHSILHLK